jgi:hypothetical protein
VHDVPTFKAMQFTPWKIFTLIVVWPSAAVKKTCDFLVGMVLSHEVSLVIMLPSVSIPAKHMNLVMPKDRDDIPSDKRVTSRSEQCSHSK